MNKKAILQFINEQVLPQKEGVWQYGDAKPRELMDIIQNWRRRNGFPSQMVAKVKDGFLFINDSPVGRIGAIKPRCAYSERAEYREGRILARQEEGV